MLDNFTLDNRSVAVIGLGYVGLPLAIEFGKRREVIAFDNNKQRISELKAHIEITGEVEHSELVEAKSVKYTSNPDDLSGADIFIVSVPTPIDDAKQPDLGPLEKATSTVAKYLKVGSFVIYESTVFPGATEEICVPILEKISCLKAIFSEEDSKENGFFVGYSPERINPGDKKKRITDIVKVTSGSTPKAAKFVDELYREIITAGTYMTPSIKVAEAAKVIENAQRDLNIAFVNELSQIFSKLNIDTHEVLEAAQTKWNFLKFFPGLVGGHCIGVDPYYLTYKANMIGHHAKVILAGREVNDEMPGLFARLVIKAMVQNGIVLTNSSIAVLGVSFKANCRDIRNTRVIDLVKELEWWGINVIVCDPIANPTEVENQFGIELYDMTNLRELDALVFAVGHDEFKNLSLAQCRHWIKDDCRPVLGDIPVLFSKTDAAKYGFEVIRL